MSGLQQIQVRGAHFDVGFAIGQRFSKRIHRALDRYSTLQEQLLPYHRSPEGQATYQELVRFNRTCYPEYFLELEGMAAGSGRPAEELFLVNLRGEYAGLRLGLERGCSDCALVSDQAALFGHNEDGSPAFRDNLYVVQAAFDGKPAFTALSYPGFLCGNAFGFNAEGVCFSVDDVQPRDVRVGISRHFIARSLLEARSLDDAVKRVTVNHRASGFSYTIGSARERRIVHVEVTPQVHHIREIRGCYVHVNHYRDLTNVDQIISESSKARAKRSVAILAENPPVDANGVLSVLGDRGDGSYPIYRTAAAPDRSATLCTALFDLDARRLRIYTGHPQQEPEQFVEFSM